MMREMIKKYIALMVLALAMASCTADMPWDLAYGDQQIDFNCQIASEATRDLSGVRSYFAKNDVIHVQGNFYFADGSEVIKYGAMKFNGSSWEPVDGSQLTWPNTAVSGKFKAYHLNGMTGILTGNESATYYLTNMKPSTDPLGSDETDLLPYGHSVDMIFRHLPTYLSFFGIPKVSTKFLFVKTNEEGAYEPTMANAFKLTKNDKNELNFEWVVTADHSWNAVGGTTEEGLNYVRSDIYVRNGVEQTNFMLAPGNYNNFSIRYETTKPNTVEYLRYTFTPGSVLDNEGNPIESLDLETGRPYTLDISTSQGITIISPPEENEGWDENGPVFDIDVESFLRAATNSQDYYVDGDNGERVQILKKDGTGVKLLHNVDFKNTYYTTFNGFLPEIRGTNQLFDGCSHYIYNVGCTIFQNNQGIIKNLGIKNATRARMVSNEKDNGFDFSRKGLLVGNNMATGNIENIRITGEVNISAYVNPTANTITTEAHNIGGVVGSNIGRIDGVALGGTFNLTVDNYQDMQFNSTVMIGGLVGQNAGNAKLTNVSTLTQPFTMNIVNRCKGNGGTMDAGAFYVGGFVGQSSATIDNVNLSGITVDGSQSVGVVSYIGGMAGNVISQTNTTGRLSSCTVTGSVKPGLTKPYSAVTSETCVGGIAGTIQSATVTDCLASVSVSGATTPNARVINAVGGAFGMIRSASSVRSILAYGDLLTGVSNGWELSGIGCFAGLIPAGQSWSSTYQNNDITIKKFDGYNEVGGNLDPFM